MSDAVSSVADQLQAAKLTKAQADATKAAYGARAAAAAEDAANAPPKPSFSLPQGDSGATSGLIPVTVFIVITAGVVRSVVDGKSGVIALRSIMAGFIFGALMFLLDLLSPQLAKL